MQNFVLPQKIIFSKDVIKAENLLIEKALQIGFNEPLVTNFIEGSSIILDFGLELNGGIKILVTQSSQSKTRVRFGESVGECCAEIGEKNATNDHAIRDCNIFLPTWSMEVVGNTGFRFVRLDFDGEIEIKSIVAINHILIKESVYKYSGNDTLINNIFNTAKRTIDLCVTNGYIFDGIKRDRLVWIGDLYPEMHALTTLYGATDEAENSLTFIKSNTPVPKWMNGFPTYSMWWIIILAKYFKLTNKEQFVKEQISYLNGLVKQMLDCVDINGIMSYPAFFVDWPTYQKPEEIHGARAINILAAKSAIFLFKHFKQDTAPAQELLNRLLNIEILPNNSKQVIALKYFAVGINDKEKERLIVGGARGMSTFMAYFILKAVASFDKQKAIGMMKEYFGAMLDKGATTFWEDFDIDWLSSKTNNLDRLAKDGEKDIHGDFGSHCYTGFRHSLCHGWASGVIAFIKEECEN